MIEEIKLNNFKCYEVQSFNFSQLTVFCGNNSVGKSTAVQALAILLQSNFNSRVEFNGSLVNIGSYQDIISNKAKTEEISIQLKRDNNIQTWSSIDKNQPALTNKSIQNSKSSHAELDLQYLQAERFGPRNNNQLSHEREHDFWLGCQGEFTSQVLHSLLNEKREKLSSSDKYGNDRTDQRTHNSLSKNPAVFKNIEAWMSEISPNFSMSPQRINDANISYNTYSTDNVDSVKPINVGFGLSYALSVVTALLCTKPGGLIIIENPEAHLHPRGQSYIGRLIALTALAGIQVIIETHSEHVINGIRIIARLESNYKTETFKINFIDKTENGDSFVIDLPIGNQGEIPDWPNGFFDQQSIDVSTLIKGKE